MKNTACQGCEDRHQGCHADCEKYKEWKKAHEAKKLERENAKLRDKIPDSVRADYVVKSKESYKKRHK